MTPTEEFHDELFTAIRKASRSGLSMYQVLGLLEAAQFSLLYARLEPEGKASPNEETPE